MKSRTDILPSDRFAAGLRRPRVATLVVAGLWPLATVQALAVALIRLTDPAAGVHASEWAVGGLIAAGWIACAVAGLRARAVGEWLARRGVWGWPIAVLVVAAWAVFIDKYPFQPAVQFAARGALVYAVIVLNYHALIHFASWRAVGRFLFTEGENARGRWLVPLVFTPLFYHVVQLYNARVYGTVAVFDAVAVDLTLQVLVGYVLLSLARRVPLMLVTHFLLIAILYTGSTVKAHLLGGPILPTDVLFLKELVWIVTGWKRWLIVLPLGGLFFSWLVNLRWHKIASPIALAVVAAVALLVWLQPGAVVRTLDARYGWNRWYYWKDYEARGATLYLIGQTARILDRAPKTPTAEQLDAANRALRAERPGPLSPAGKAQRNVYVLVLESLWNPTALGAGELTGDPFAPEFYALWDAGGRSRALSPTAYHQTPNAEYEILCGLPELSGEVVNDRIANRVPCLPGLMADAGYGSYAFHPNSGGFWNRTTIYYRFGFDRFFAKNSFERDDMNGAFLADESLFRQMRSILADRGDGRPHFAYVMSYTGHWPYSLNEERRPPVLRSRNGHEVVEHFANSIYYTTRELVAFLDELRAADPTALIAVCGDHIPFFGDDQDVYRTSGFSADNPEHYDAAMWLRLAATPLIVIDGERGPVAVGDLPMYRLPELLFSLLGFDPPWTARYAPRGLGTVRTFDESILLAFDAGEMLDCRPADDRPLCRRAWNWREAIDTVSIDVMSGDQLSVR